MKIPHHASRGAFSKRLYRRLCVTEPVGAITRFSNGNVALPRPDMISSLKEVGLSGFVCGEATGSVPQPKDLADASSLAVLSGASRPFEAEVGGVAATADQDGTWSYVPFGQTVKF
ncbi:MAG: hypothetical protein Q7T55_05200 [Solirubrobacteraceae bacterium]|nr:hypothetical protein [Solirubrobacteraceae bacterium]